MTDGKIRMPAISRQRGLSLISLLIGLLISVLCILASLTLYKNLIQVATESKLDSNHDGQITSAMLVIQMEVQSAGYGIANAGTNEIAQLTGTNKPQLAWRSKDYDSTNYYCRGLLEKEVTIDDAKYRELSLVTVSGTCNGTTALSGFTWDQTLSTLGRWRVIADSAFATYITNNTNMFGYSLSGSIVCNPYGTSSASTTAHKQLTVTVPSTASLAGAAGVSASSYKFCLPNIYP